eukprot:TRINITY_DN7038_c0_g1_i1.p1 TRINITY_DN7038_c0_g1~~TRINITY_DN7038_c0_g1_i1.p1  ORF type:complete len:303 (+),score=64.57 TRINITY_DN7038_c0_g1_i1:22-909(+)
MKPAAVHALLALAVLALQPSPARADRPTPPLNISEFAHQRVLAIGAHPDDIETMMGGTLNQLRAVQARVSYLIVTNGNAGGQCYNASHDRYDCSSEELAFVRRNEQLAAAQVLGVAPEDVQFLNHPDGQLTAVPEQDVRREITAWVRKFQPFAVFAWFLQPDLDAKPGHGNVPHNWDDLGYHPDHMASGRIAFDACVGPSAGNAKVFPELLGAGLQPWPVPRFYLFSVSVKTEYYVALTSEDIDAKTNALARHESQNPSQLLPQLRASVLWIAQSVAERIVVPGVTYAEGFRYFF